jgi:hypothetical protein
VRRKYAIAQLRYALDKLEGVPKAPSTGKPLNEPLRIFPNASFSRLGNPKDDPLPTSEEQVTEFIRCRTRLYLHSYVISYIKEVIDELESGK